MAKWIIETNRPASGESWDELDRADNNVECVNKFAVYLDTYRGTGIKVRRRRVEVDEGVRYVCVVMSVTEDDGTAIAEAYGPFKSRADAENYGDRVTDVENYTYYVRLMHEPVASESV